MRILWITLECIYPPNTGGRIGVFKRLEQLYSKGNEIYLFYPYDSDSDLQAERELKKYCKEVFAYKRKKSFRTLLKLLRYPYTIASRDIKELQRDIADCIEKNNIEIINVDFPHMCVNLFGIVKNYAVPIVLNQHNIEWEFYREVAHSNKNILKKFLYFTDSFRLKRYEERLSKKINFSGITFVSDLDMQYYAQWIGKKEKLRLIPVGADIPSCGNEYTKKSSEKIIIFAGKMSAAPNEDAVVWFVYKILPLVLAEFPDLKFYIVGKDPTKSVLKLANRNVVVTGMVESLDEYYKTADLVVLPLRHGEGVKVKLLEAMSYAKPVVTTSVGSQGILHAENIGFRIDDEAHNFADDCISLLKDREQAFKTGEKLYEYFLRNYTWEIIGENYQEFLQGICRKNEGSRINKP